MVKDTKAALKAATDAEIMAELERRFDSFLCIAEGTTNGKRGWGRWRAGNSLSIFGMLHAVEAQMRLDFIRFDADPTPTVPASEPDGESK